MISNNEFHAITELDLEPIKVKLMHKESGEGWSREYADAVEAEYRRFLYMMKMFPNEGIAPRFDVDIFWHYHILDTMKYAVDCDDVFGYFLHHFPYLGLRSEADEELHERAGARMQELYESIFDEPYFRAMPVSIITDQASVQCDAVAVPIQSLQKVAYSFVPVQNSQNIAYSFVPIQASQKIAYSFVPIQAARETDGDGKGGGGRGGGRNLADPAVLRRLRFERPVLAAA